MGSVMFLRRIRFTMIGVLLALALACQTPAGAQDAPMTLRVADALPAGFPMTQYSSVFWMERVTKATNGAVKFAHFPAEQLGKAKDLLSLTQSGVIDIGYIVPAYVTEKLPLSSVAELPGSFKTTCEGVAAYWKLIKDGALARDELAPNGVKAVFAALNPPYQAFTRTKELSSLEAFRGLKIRAASGGQAIMMRKLGAVPINITGLELYEALSHGTVDGLLFPIPGIVGYDLGSLVTNMTTGQNFGDVVTFHAISLRRWNELPQNVRAAMDEAGDAATQNACEMLDRDAATNAEDLKKKGVKVSALSAEDQAKLNEVDADVAKQWAEDLDKRGKPGSAVLQAFRQALGK